MRLPGDCKIKNVGFVFPTFFQFGIPSYLLEPDTVKFCVSVRNRFSGECYDYLKESLHVGDSVTILAKVTPTFLKKTIGKEPNIKFWKNIVRQNSYVIRRVRDNKLFLMGEKGLEQK